MLAKLSQTGVLLIIVAYLCMLFSDRNPNKLPIWWMASVLGTLAVGVVLIFICALLLVWCP